jgi:hypothetical protein
MNVPLLETKMTTMAATVIRRRFGNLTFILLEGRKPYIYN